MFFLISLGVYVQEKYKGINFSLVFVFVFCKCANQNGLISALFIWWTLKKVNTKFKNIFWYFSYLARIWRNKRYKNQQRQMKTPRVRKYWTPRERNRNTGRKGHIHNRRSQGEKGTFWMWQMGTSLHVQNWTFINFNNAIHSVCVSHR